MQFNNPLLEIGKPGHVFEGVRAKCIRAYANASGGAVSESRMSFAINCPPAQPFEVSGDKRDKIRFEVTTTGACCIPAVTLEFCLPNPIPKDPAELYEAMIAAFAANSRMGGLGSFRVDGTELVFTASQPGFDVDFNILVDPAYVTASGSSTAASGFGEHLEPGLAVVIDPTVQHAVADDFTEDTWGIAFAPTQDVNDPASTQKWVGVVADCDDHESMPAMGCWPNLSNCGPAECMPKPKCLRVLEKGSIIIRVEQNADFTQGCPQLYYRYAIDGEFNQLGAFSFVAGAGLAPVPVQYNIVRAYENGLVKVSF